MRWFPYFILAYVALGVQSGLGAFAQVGRATPNFVLLAVVFIAVNAPRDAALLGCVVLGLLQDLLTNSPLGLWAMAYGAVGLFIVQTQDLVYREHFLTHFTLGLAGGLVSGAIVLIHGWVYPLLHPAPHLMRPAVGPVLASALYTGLLAPIVLGLLQRTKKVFAFKPSRRNLMKRA
jgi:rod shape-determining protein MreD